MNTQTLAMTTPMHVSGSHLFAQAMAGQDFRMFAAARQALNSQREAVQVTVMGRADFIHHVTLHLPEVAALIEEEDFGNLHLEMGAMKLATRQAILRYEFYTIRRHFSFIAYLFEHAGKELRDAILISYLEGLFIGEAQPEFGSALAMLPDCMKEALKKVDRYFKLVAEGHHRGTVEFLP